MDFAVFRISECRERAGVQTSFPRNWIRTCRYEEPISLICESSVETLTAAEIFLREAVIRDREDAVRRTRGPAGGKAIKKWTFSSGSTSIADRRANDEQRAVAEMTV